MELFTEFELLIMGSVIGILVFIILVLSISEIISNKREKRLLKIDNQIDEDNEIDTSNQFQENLQPEVATLDDTTKNDDLEIEYLEIQEINPEKIATSPKEDIYIEDLSNELEEEPKKETDFLSNKIAFREIENLEDDLDDVNITKIETDEGLTRQETAQLELAKIEEELEHSLSLEDTITNLEAIEEENAIISYQDLVNNNDINSETVSYDDDGNEPISINEVFQMFNNQTSKIEKPELKELESFNQTYLYNVSPSETESLSEIQLENTANLEKLEKEIRKTNKFLNILNELKKNLD